MIPGTFDYVRAESVEDAVRILSERGEDAKLLAGGHSLIPLLKLRLSQPGVLVDVGHLSELSYVREVGDEIAIGAMTRHAEAASNDTLQAGCPIVAYTAGQIGDPQVRNFGTIGGSVAHGDPASDLPAVLLALEAEFVVRGPGEARTVGAADFFKGLFEVDIAPQEILTEVRVPRTGSAGWSYLKFNHRAQDWAIVGVAAVASNGTARVALTTMGETPLRARGVEDALAAGADSATAAERADEGTSPPSDPFGSAEYRRDLAKVLTKRALEEALGGN